jgi:hypothetical protein
MAFACGWARDYSPAMISPLPLTAYSDPSPPPDTMRRKRLLSLAEPQELFVERRVAGGAT